MFANEINKILFIIIYLNKTIFNWIQSQIKNYLNNQKKN